MKREKLDALTGLRFFAAFAIVLIHIRGNFGIPLEYFIAWRPELGVTVFFVLSGFVLTYAHPLMEADSSGVWRFYIARIARIWPAHAATLLAALALGAPFSAGLFAANAALVHGWIPRGDYFFGYNSVSWSISTEFGFYLLFPFLMWKLSSTWLWKLMLALAAGVGAVYAASILHFPGYSGGSDVVLQGLVMTSPLARIFEFTAGMATAALWLRYRGKIDVSAHIWTATEALVIGAFIWVPTAIEAGLRPFLPGAVPLWYWLGASFTPVIPIALALAVFASGKGLLSRFLSARPIVFLGEISFAIYLTHQLVLRWFASYARVFNGWPDPALIFVFFAVVLVASTALHKLVEIPAQDAIKRLVRLVGGHRDPIRAVALQNGPLARSVGQDG